MKVSPEWAVVAGLAGAACLAQPLPSPQTSRVQYAEGNVLLNGRAVSGGAPVVSTDLIDCEEGRAELVLVDGVILRMDRHSILRALPDFAPPRFDLLAGTVGLEIGEAAAAAEVMGTWREATILFGKPGSYRLDTNPAALRVLEGRAQVTLGGTSIRVEKGLTFVLEGEWTVLRMDGGPSDEFERWWEQRMAELAVVHVLTVNEIRTSSVETDRGREHGSSRSTHSESESATEASSSSTSPKTASTTSAGTSGTIAASSPASTSSSSASSAPVARDTGNAGGARR